MACPFLCEITNGERAVPCGPECEFWDEFRKYADEFTKADAAGEASCGALNEGGWAICSRPEHHEDEHAALDSNLCTVTTWERTPPRVVDAPDLFREKCPDEPWIIWVHKSPKDFEWDSYGASAGFMAGGTEVKVLKRWNILLTEGPMAGQNIAMLKVRGSDVGGKQITGWVLARDIVEDD